MKPVCLADRVRNYINYTFDELEGKTLDTVVDSNGHIIVRNYKVCISKETREFTDFIYKKLRGELFISNTNPRTLAGAIVFIAFEKTGIVIPKRVIAKTLNLKTESAIRHKREQLLTHLYYMDNTNEELHIRFKSTSNLFSDGYYLIDTLGNRAQWNGIEI